MLMNSPMGSAAGTGIGDDGNGIVTGTDATGPRFTMTGTGIGKGSGIGKGIGITSTPHGDAAGNVEALDQVEHPAHGLMGGAALH